MISTEFEYESQGISLIIKAKCDNINEYGADNLKIELYDLDENEIILGELPFNRKEWVALEEYATDKLMDEMEYDEL